MASLFGAFSCEVKFWLDSLCTLSASSKQLDTEAKARQHREYTLLFAITVVFGVLVFAAIIWSTLQTLKDSARAAAQGTLSGEEIL